MLASIAHWSPEWVSAVADWTSNVLVIISVLFVAWQVRDIRSQMKNSIVASYWVQWTEIDKWFAEHPEFRPYFYNGAVLDPDVDYDPAFIGQLDSAAELLLDSFAGLHYQSLNTVGREECMIFRRFIAGMYQHQPFFRDFVDSHIEWYSEDFGSFIRDHVGPVCGPDSGRSA